MVLLESVPNVSEGRDQAVIAAIGTAFAAHGRVLDVHSDIDHHRSVYTIVAEANDLVDALLARVGKEGVKDDDVFTDMLSFVPVYEIETTRKLFSKTYQEVPAGFEIQKNIHIRFRDARVLDKLVSADWVTEHMRDANVRLVEVDVDTEAYKESHLDGAVGWNWTTQLCDTLVRDIVCEAIDDGIDFDDVPELLRHAVRETRLALELKATYDGREINDYASTLLAVVAHAEGTVAGQIGDGAIVVVRVTTLERGGADAIAFLANPKYRAQLAGTGAAAVDKTGRRAPSGRACAAWKRDASASSV